MGDKILIAFDFDHTVIDDNSDVHVINLAPDGVLPQSVKDTYDEDGWTEYMGRIFEYLYKNGVRKEDIRKNMNEIQLTNGMLELFELINEDRYESIIISDSNSLFIQYVLENLKLDTVFSEVFTNPAAYDDNGCLTIKFYHTQDYCSLSTVNLCKGRILTDFIQSRKKNGIHYSHVIYVGDGTNDFCPGLVLSSRDYLCPRKGFKLWKKLNKTKNKDSNVDNMKARVVNWESGIDIKELIKTL